MERKIFLDINNAINIYNYHVYINKISGVENFTINQLISEILNEKFKALNDYSIIPYTTTSVLGKDFYNIFYLKTLRNRYVDLDYNYWLNSFYNNFQMSDNECYLALEKLINKIKKYQLNPMNINKLLVKDKLYPNSLLGSKRLGTIETLNMNQISQELVLQRIPESIYAYNLCISKIKGELNIHKLQNIKYASPFFIPHIVSQKVPPLINGQSINTICYYFESNDEYSKTIYGPMLQGYLTQYGHSILFKKLRIEKFQLYHFEAHFDQETNILFIQYIVDENWKIKVWNLIISEVMDLNINKEEFQTMKIFLSNEYRFKFDKSFGEFNHILSLGNKFLQSNNIFKAIQDIKIQDFIKFLDNKKMINIVYEG